MNYSIKLPNGATPTIYPPVLSTVHEVPELLTAQDLCEHLHVDHAGNCCKCGLRPGSA